MAEIKDTLSEVANTILCAARVAQRVAERIEADLFSAGPPQPPTQAATDPSALQDVLSLTSAILTQINDTLARVASGVRNAPPQNVSAGTRR